MQMTIDPNSVDDYRLFLRVKGLPSFRCVGHTLEFPDEYAALVNGHEQAKKAAAGKYKPLKGLFDYQRDIAVMAVRKKRFAVFADCGLGKTLILSEFARHCWQSGKKTLIVSPLMVVRQTMDEVGRWYGDKLPIEVVPASGLGAWLERGGKPSIAITNYDALHDETPQGNLGAMILDESSMLKSHYGKWGQTCLRLGRGLEYKLALTGTPAPNDRIEYANHAVFMDAFPTVNAFLARFFVNRGQTQERWELKAHALEPFYRALSHWSIFLTNPATYGWKDNTESIPPINVTIHDVDLTTEQRRAVVQKTGSLIVTEMGGITKRSALGQIGKGNHDGVDIPTNKPEFIRSLVSEWPGKSTIVWCIYNHEQETMERQFPDAASISGDTPIEQRERMIGDFKAGRTKVIISKPKIMGFGLNMQVATKMVFSGLQDSYESYYQAVKRANRYGSNEPLDVHIPVTEIERPMVDNVLRKAAMIQRDTEEQERIFKKYAVME